MSEEDNRRRDTGNRPSQEPVQERRPLPPEQDRDRSVETLLDRLESSLMDAKNVPFSNFCKVDREEMLFFVRMIREGLPEELDRARWILQQNRQLINQARREADTIMRDAEVQMARMIDEHEITQQAKSAAAVMIEEATQKSNDIRAGALQYTREMLTNLENHLTDILVNITRNKKELG